MQFVSVILRFVYISYRRNKFKPLGGKFPFDASKDKKSESGSSDEGEFEVSTHS